MLLWSFSLFFINCADDEQMNVVADETGWKRISNYSHERRIQMNSFVEGDQLYTVGREMFTHLEPTGDESNPYFAGNYLLSVYAPYEYAPPISSRFFPVLQGNTIFCSLSDIPTLDQFDLNINVLSLDSLFQSFEYPPFKSSLGAAINNNNQLLVAYRRRESSTSSVSKISFYLTKIEQPYASGPLERIDEHFIHEDFGFRNLTAMTTFNNDFYVCGDDIAVRINAAAEFELLDAPGLTKIYGFDEKLIGIGFRKVYVSDDNGVSWVEIAAFDTNLFELKLHELDSDIIATWEDKIFHFMDADDNFLFREIDNEKLEDILITSLSKFDSKVFLTTLSGVFAKEMEDFWSYKE